MKTMKCECGKVIVYNKHYECFNCSCNKCYNALGQELSPLNEWKDEWNYAVHHEDY